MFASLAGGTKFSKFDFPNDYQQICLDESSKNLVTVNTIRLPSHVSTAPAIFQRIIDSLLQGIPNVVAYLDVILITVRNDSAFTESRSSFN